MKQPDVDGFHLVHSTPVVEAETSTGKTKYWQGHVCNVYDRVCTYTTYCQSKLNGSALGENPRWEALEGNKVSQITISAFTDIQGKNIGRSNETTPHIQALSEMESQYKKQLDKGYRLYGTVADADELPLPMLAQKLADSGHRLDWTSGVTLQPKYDGLRALTDGNKFWSRKKKVFLPQVVAHLLGGGTPTGGDLFSDPVVIPPLDTEGHILDGELILPPPYPLQKTMSAASAVGPLTPHLVYRVYDVLEPTLNYPERYALIERLVKKANNPQIILAERCTAFSEDEVWPVHEAYVKAGWEGTMIRSNVEGYRIGQRSASLLKLKDFEDDEFEVVNVIEGVGKFVGAAILVCKTKDGSQTFNTTPMGTMEYRRELFARRAELIGTVWTVRYQAFTEGGKPQFGRAVNIRNSDLQG